ncbi:citrate/2-methylcitrate synthase [candidate division WOR-3 bacterium]|nr:citrate/2-methylcitrate synthase [candidate division WOR-3 bacterium]
MDYKNKKIKGVLKQDYQFFSHGLEGVAAFETSISYIDGKDGILIYRGIPIGELAERSTYEETAYFLIYGSLPTKAELKKFSNDLENHISLDTEDIKWLKDFPVAAHPMDVLNTCVSLMSLSEGGDYEIGRESDLKAGIQIMGKMPSIIAAFDRIRKGKEPIPPDNKLSYAANFLWMLNGEKPKEKEARILDLCLILHAEHGVCASTFATLVTSSTMADVYSSIVSGIGTLKGYLHGGANEQVIRMLERIGAPENVEKYLNEATKKKEKIMGFGHRVYKALDPRARILKNYARDLTGKRDEVLFKTALKIEKFMEKKFGPKGIYPNVDFYSGFVYKALGIPTDMFTSIFAIARSAGWIAHILEYRESSRIFRPRGIYSGPVNVKYIPIKAR